MQSYCVTAEDTVALPKFYPRMQTPRIKCMQTKYTTI